MLNWRIREAGVSDADNLGLVGAATFLETFAGSLDGSAIVAHCQREHSAEVYDRYMSQGAWAWIAEVAPGNAPVGYALAGATELPGSDPAGSDLELKRIYTLSRMHGTGVGAKLLSEVVKRCAEIGASRLLLGVYAGNARAISFYRRHGFAQIASRRFRVGDRDYDDIVMANAL